MKYQIINILISEDRYLLFEKKIIDTLGEKSSVRYTESEDNSDMVNGG